MRYLNNTPLEAIDASSNADSAAIDASYILQVSLQAVVVGADAAGTLYLQASNDPPLDPPTPPTNWVNIPDASVVVAGAGNLIIPKIDICYQWIRVIFRATDGSAGTITATIKTVGA